MPKADPQTNTTNTSDYSDKTDVRREENRTDDQTYDLGVPKGGREPGEGARPDGTFESQDQNK